MELACTVLRQQFEIVFFSTTPFSLKKARVAAVIASDFRFAYFGTAAFAVRLLRLDQTLAHGVPSAPHVEHLEHQAGAIAGILRPSREAGL